MAWRWWWFAVVMLVALTSELALSNPQINQLDMGCSTYNVTDVPLFFSQINASFADLENQLSTGDKRFATTQQPVYTMIQCRDYLSKADCVDCFNAAVSVSRKCKIATGARVIFDGCFLRYESNLFYNKITDEGNHPICGKRTAHNQDAFNTTAGQLLNDLVEATPKINGFFAAAKQEVSGGNATAYAVAQCIQTITPSGCQACLTLAFSNIQGCLGKSAAARAVDIGCFLRYSDKHFFASNQTTNLAPFLGGGGIKLNLFSLFMFLNHSLSATVTKIDSLGVRSSYAQGELLPRRQPRWPAT